MLHHKESCINKSEKKSFKCEQCDIIINEFNQIKKHMRDVHAIQTASTSPPQKNKESITEKLDGEIEAMETDSGSLDDVSFRAEDMDVEEVASEEEIALENSKKMDEKVKEKEKKDEEKKLIFKSKQKELEKKKQESRKRSHFPTIQNGFWNLPTFSGMIV